MPTEILLVSDGSFGDGLSVCRDYEKDYPNLIKVIDGNDYINEKTLEHFLSILRTYGDLDFVHGRMSYFWDGEEKPNFRVHNSWFETVPSGQNALKRYLSFFSLCGKMRELGGRKLYERV